MKLRFASFLLNEYWIALDWIRCGGVPRKVLGRPLLPAEKLMIFSV